MTIHSLVIQKLLSTNAHIGRQVAGHHFKIYTHGIRNKQVIIDSDKTLICLRNASNFISLLARQKANFLFVNTNPLFDEIIEQMTKKIGIYRPNHANLWKMGGFLTNNFSPKKFRSRNKKVCFGPTSLPDCVVVFDTERKSSVVLEASKLEIPIVALVDSSMPWEFFKKITYPVPANDSAQFVYLFCNMITKSFMLEQKRMQKGGKDEMIEGKNLKVEEAKIIEENKKRSAVSSANHSVLVVPYDNLTTLPSNDATETKELLDKLVVVKFNKALGTDMGFTGPKSMIEACSGSTFLDLTVRHIEALNAKYGCSVPLLLMNTTETHNDTLKVIEKYSKSNVDIHPLSQSQESLQVVNEGEISNDELCESDHAAQFLALMRGGTLDLLLSQGKEYALVVDPDNVAASVDQQILNHLIQNKIEYCIEVTPTKYLESRDSLFNTQEGKFELGDITWNSTKHSVEKFNFIDTRSLWVSLKAIRRLLDTDELKMETKVSASKAVDGDKYSLQGTAAGSATQLFNQTIGINVPRSRFLPIKTTSDLLLLQSDLYTSNEGILVRNTARTNPADPSIDLGSEFTKVSDFHSRFKSIPSIIQLDNLNVTGDVWFGSRITLKGRVSIRAKPGTKIEIPNGTVLENKEINCPADIF